MKRVALLVFLILPAALHAQTTAVTATVTDSDSIAWANGSFVVTFVPNPTFNGQYQYNGSAMTDAQKGPYRGSMDGTGTLSVTIPDSSFISPAGTKWLFTFCPDASATCATSTLPVTGGSVNLSTTFSGASIAPRFPAKGIGSYGYSDVEINQVPVPGGSYYNVTSLCRREWNGSAFGCPATGGTVTSFSAGNLSPLFSSSVATPTTTPALSFSLSNAAAHTFFGNNTGSTSAPGFVAITTADLPAGTGTVTAFSSGNLSPLFTTSVATPTSTPAQSFAQISQSQNLFFASPNGSSGNPSFRALVSADLPAGTGTVTSIATTSPISGGPITTTGTISCPTCLTSTGLGVTKISTGFLGGASCTPAASSFATCTSVITISPTQADTSYVPMCVGLSPSDPRAYLATAAATSTTTITATVENLGSASGVNFGNVGCVAVHP